MTEINQEEIEKAKVYIENILAMKLESFSIEKFGINQAYCNPYGAVKLDCKKDAQNSLWVDFRQERGTKHYQVTDIDFHSDKKLMYIIERKLPDSLPIGWSFAGLLGPEDYGCGDWLNFPVNGKKIKISFLEKVIESFEDEVNKLIKIKRKENPKLGWKIKYQGREGDDMHIEDRS